MSIHHDRFKLVTVCHRPIQTIALPCCAGSNISTTGSTWVLWLSIIRYLQVTKSAESINTISPPSKTVQLSLPSIKSIFLKELFGYLEILEDVDHYESSWFFWITKLRWSKTKASFVLLSRGHGLTKNWRKEVKETSLQESLRSFDRQQRIKRDLNMDVSKNRGGPPKSSILTGFSIINHPFWGTSIFGNTHMAVKETCEQFPSKRQHNSSIVHSHTGDWEQSPNKSHCTGPSTATTNICMGCF